MRQADVDVTLADVYMTQADVCVPQNDVAQSLADVFPALAAQRPTYLIFPNGRVIRQLYDGHNGIDTAVSRPNKVSDDNGPQTLVEYAMLGDGTLARKDYQQPQVRLDLWGGTSGTYAGLDRFGRTIDHKWVKYNTSTDLERLGHGYDRAGNRTYRENQLATLKDEHYGYDGLHRLGQMDRGDLNGTYTGISGTPVRTEDWGLDALGNWSSFLIATSGVTDLDQTRTHSKANEIASISETTGPAWADPVHDLAGNMTGIPKPTDPTQSYTGTK